MILSRKSLHVVVGAAGLLALLLSSGFAGDEPRTPDKQGDFVCGPRCVHYVLRCFGIQSDLVALVRESQWPEIENGATLDALERALNARGVSTFAMSVAPGSRVNWPHPVIVHLKESDGQLGHYVVLLPGSKNATAAVWAGLQGIQRGSAFKLATRMSGAVLLTSDAPIRNPQDAVRQATRLPFWLRLSVMVVIMALASKASWLRLSAGIANRKVSRSVPIGVPSCDK